MQDAQNNRSIFLDAAKYVLLALALAAFIVNKTVFFGYIEGKSLYIKGVIALALVLMAIFFLTTNKEKKARFIAEKKRFLKNPIFIFLALFLLSALVSSFFALNKYRAFFSYFEREEGMIGFFFFFSFLLLALFCFGRKEWNIFFGLTFASGTIFVLQAVTEFIKGNGAIRPVSTFGNPAYLAGYMLFVIFSALILIAEVFQTRRSKTEKAFFIAGAAALILASSVVIAMTQVRGAMLALAAGFLCATIYFALTVPKGAGLKKSLVLAISGLIVLAVFMVGGLALTYKQSAKKSLTPLPQFILQRTISVGSFQTRFIAAKVSLRAINPQNVGVKKFLFGWGPENYHIAYNSYFDPNYFKYENVWFDRAHNKIFDVLVMHGFLGLMLYLGLWASVLFVIFRHKAASLTERLYPAAAIFFAVSYFTQNLFLFDTISTYVAFFAFLAFAAFRFSSQQESQIQGNKGFFIFTPVFFTAAFLILALLGSALFMWGSFLPHMQAKKYIYLKSGDLSITQLAARLDEVLTPYYNGQDLIRMDLIKSVDQFNRDDPGFRALENKNIEAVNDLIRREPYEPRFAMNMGVFLENIGKPELAEDYYRKALALSPARPDLLYLLGQNLMVRGKADEAKQAMAPLLEQSKTIPQSGIFYGIALAQAGPTYRSQSFEVLESSLGAISGQLPTENISVLRTIYEQYLLNFYLEKKKDDFIRAISGAIKIEQMWEKNQEGQYRQGLIKEPPAKKSEIYQKILDEFQKNEWDTLKIEVEQ